MIIKNSEKNEFSELIRYTLFGYIAGIVSGIVLDRFGFQKSGLGQAFVRTLSGEGESIFEGFYAIKKRLSKVSFSMAEAYAWGKFIGMFLPWVIDFSSRMLGVDVYGIEGFYIPYFYALSDQIGANISGAIFIYRKTGNFSLAAREYFKSPVMVASLLIVLLVPLGLFLARVFGFSPSTQTLAAFETIAANLCWAPPLVGHFTKDKEHKTCCNHDD
ncbi:MAG: hypothetical protein HY746_03305 [Elusimicrobia bacterium]|nr:hypothetical protein [Elusimicrobiota bacterium]